MLQLMTQSARTGAAGEGQVLPQGLAQGAADMPDALVGEVLPEVFGEQLALSAEALAGEPSEVPGTVGEVREETPQTPDLPSAEQWLLSMLDQRAASVQAREGVATPPAEAVAIARTAGAPAPLALPPRELLPAPGHTLPDAQPSVPTASVEAVDVQLSSALERAAGHPAQTLLFPAGHGQPALAQPPVLERQLSLQAPEAKWGEQMLHALRDSVELQMRHNVQNASIRLDPPELGSLEIYLSHESGRLNVQISAAQGDVARLLQQTSERLRQELVGQNFVQVDVQVAADGQSGRQHGRQGRSQAFGDEPVRAASVVEDPQQRGGGQAGDVLVTV
ncbi:Flagellar hook-length control protein FliK [compost metagenome]